MLFYWECCFSMQLHKIELTLHTAKARGSSTAFHLYCRHSPSFVLLKERRKSMKINKLTASVILFIILFATGCHKGNSPQTVVTLSGSTSMEEVIQALSEGFTEQNPDIAVIPQFSGSSQGIRDAAEGKADIGISSRELYAGEKASLDAVTVAVDGIAVIVHPDNPITDLTFQQLSDIYTGNIRNWKEAGGTDSPIVVIGRDTASGTRTAFEELLGISGQCTYGQEKDSSGGIKIAVEATPEAIGYVSLEAADANKKTKKISLEGVEASEEKIHSGEYFLSRPLLMVTRKGEQLQPEAQLFLDYVLSGEGQEIIQSQSLIPIT